MPCAIATICFSSPDRRLADRHLDDAHRHRVAGVSLDSFAFLLGLVGFCGQIPVFLLGPFAGVWVDRWNRHRVLVVTQILSMVQSFCLAVLALSHRITVTDIILLSLFQGTINAFDMPARQAFVIQMVEEREDLPNAIALNSSMVNVLAPARSRDRRRRHRGCRARAIAS